MKYEVVSPSIVPKLTIEADTLASDAQMLYFCNKAGDRIAGVPLSKVIMVLPVSETTKETKL